MNEDKTKQQQLRLIGLDQPTETLYNVLANTKHTVEPLSPSSSRESSSSSDEANSDED